MLRHPRPVFYLAALATSVMAVTPPVEAGRLCDWLFGNRTAAYPAAPPAYSVNYPPVYAAGYAPIATATAPTAAPLTTYRPTLNGATAAQMPAYAPPATATPNGYAGIYSSYYGANPVATPAPAPTSSFYGTGNIYPDPLQPSRNAVATTNYAPSNAPAYTTNDAPSYAANNAAASASYYAPPSNTVIAPAPRTGLLGGVRRFFGALFGTGTGYQTSYYRAPVTYYRPITTVDPTSGATVTSQRACTGSQYQIQRSPIRRYQGVQTPQAAPDNNGCGSEAPFPNTSLPANPAGEGYVPQPTLPANGFDPYATQRSTYGDALANPPASSYRSYPSYPADNTAPLRGTPRNGTSNGARNGAAQGDASAPDQRTVPQPQLDPNSSTLRGYRRMPENAASTNRSGWRSASPETSRPAPLTPRREARPIPAPPSLWPGEEQSPSTDGQGEGGRTAVRPTWGSKKIVWASHRQPATMAPTNTTMAHAATAKPGPANVGHANVGHANVGHANVGHANVGHANVGHANLGHANLGHANLAAANGAAAGRVIAEPTAAADADADADAAVRQVDHVTPAPQPPRARPEHAPAPRPRYDDSGWE